MSSSGLRTVQFRSLGTNSDVRVRDLIIYDSAAHGEQHVVTPTDSKYVSGVVDHLSPQKMMEFDDGNWQTKFCNRQ